MKIYWVLLALCGLTLVAVIAGVVISSHQQKQTPAPIAEQVFRVKGQVRDVEPDGKTVRIAHEEIPGFMPPMEMPFTVKDPSLLKGLAAGDAVRFELRVTKDDSWLAGVEKVEAAATSGVVQATRTKEEGSAEAEPQRVSIGETVPDFVLVDQDGKTFHLRDLRGKAVVLTFVYTRCPLPNFCPLMSRNFASLQERFSKGFPGKARLLSISFDPQFDTPAVLKGYAHLYDADPRIWTFATGTPNQIDIITGLFGLIRENSNGLINHDLRTALISPEGKLVHVWRSNVWTPFEVQRMVQETLLTNVASTSLTR